MIEQVGIALFGVTAAFLSQDKRPHVQRWACVFGLLGQPFWVWTAINTHAWGILVLTPLYALSWGRGFWNFWIAPTLAQRSTAL